MTKINTLLKEISAIETEAAIPDLTKEELYDLLIKAYSKAKDVIVHLQEVAPEPVKVVDTDHIDQLTFQLDESQSALTLANGKLDKITEILVPGLT